MARQILQTPRLVLDELATDRDEPFVLALLNEPAFLHHIGDRQVHDLAAASCYLRDGPLAHYREQGFGLWRVVSRQTGAPIGLCGLLRRPSLPLPDLGYALLRSAWGQGLALEAAAATLAHAHRELGITQVAAITWPGNVASERLLGKLGFVFQREQVLPGDDRPSRLFHWCPGEAKPPCQH